MTCTCSIGRTLVPERLQELDAALRAGRPGLRALATDYGVSKTSAGEHKLRCLGIAPGPSPIGPRGRPAGRPEVSGETALRTPDVAPRARNANAISPIPDVPPDTFDDHVVAIADMIAASEWKGRRTITELSERWGLSREAVRERYRAGAALARADRGDIAEALERAIGEAASGAEGRGATARELEQAGDVDSLHLAAKFRALEKGWREKQWQLEGLLVQKLSISIEGDPRLAGLWPVIWEAAAEIDAAQRLYVAEVEKLTGGVAPSVELPSAHETIKRAIVAYEARTGGREGMRLGAGASS